jgi:hypothetical protein
LGLAICRSGNDKTTAVLNPISPKPQQTLTGISGAASLIQISCLRTALRDCSRRIFRFATAVLTGFREQPGLEAPVLLLGAEAEVFRVEQGPQDADGYVWWYLVGPYDPARLGWAVANYLEVVQNP